MLAIAMHELSIAINLVDIAGEEVAKLGPGRVAVVHLRLGRLSGVVQDALLFSYDLATAGTRLEGSRLEIEEVPIVVFCSECRGERELPGIRSFRCPECGTPSGEIVAGRELELRRLEFVPEEEDDGGDETPAELRPEDQRPGAPESVAEVR